MKKKQELYKCLKCKKEVKSLIANNDFKSDFNDLKWFCINCFLKLNKDLPEWKIKYLLEDENEN